MHYVNYLLFAWKTASIIADLLSVSFEVVECVCRSCLQCTSSVKNINAAIFTFRLYVIEDNP